MGFSTSNNLLIVSPQQVNRSMLTYSTATLTGRTRSATATPDPDYFGNTNYLNSAGVGVDVSSSNSSFDVGVVSTNRYPNYTLLASIKPQYMGNYSATLTPSIVDSGGVVGTTSGTIFVNQSRSFQWGIYEETIFNTVYTSTATGGIIFENNEFMRAVEVENFTIGNTINSIGQWSTLLSLPQNAGLYNEVMFENSIGSASWSVVSVNSISTTMTAGRSKGVFYDLSGVGVRIDPLLSSGSRDCYLKVTFRNKANPSITHVENFIRMYLGRF